LTIEYRGVTLRSMRFFSSTSLCACAAPTMDRRPASFGVIVIEIEVDN
jgi:hypothetical protein